MCADIALHDKNDGNPHYHILLTMRPLNEDTTWRAKSKKEYILDENGIQDKVDHRSYQRQGIKQIPTIHLGVSATQMEKKGIATDRGNINREIKHQNMILREISRRIKALLSWIRRIGKEEKTESENIKSNLPTKENLFSVFGSLIRKNAYNNNSDLEKYIESYQLLKEKTIQVSIN